MSDRGVTFAGNGRMDVGDGGMKNEKSGGMQSGGPLKSPEGSEQGMSASGEIVNIEGSVPSGGGVKFAGDV
jgi:hypothetical protein